MNGNKFSKKKVAAAELDRVNPNAVGIDVGAREHYVAVPSDRCPKPVREFGCFTPDLHQQLHSFGLLSAAFVPGKEVRVLRSYWRHREELARVLRPADTPDAKGP